MYQRCLNCRTWRYYCQYCLKQDSFTWSTVWGKVSPSVLTCSMCAFDRIIEFLHWLMTILCFTDVPTAPNRYLRLKSRNWISLELRVYLGNVKQLLNKIASPQVCISQSFFLMLEARRRTCIAYTCPWCQLFA